MIQMILVLLLAPAQDAKAQEKEKQEKLQDKLEDQEDRIKELERKLAEVEKRQAGATSAGARTAFNPTVTVSGDFLWRFDDKKVYLDNDPSKARIDDQINVREVELDLRASVDPYVDGVAIISFGAEVANDYGVDIEEFYATIKSLPLPFWDAPPLGTKIKVGRFRTEFGLNNKSHLHDLPQSDRPLVIQEFLGTDGSAANGISTTSFLPSPDDTALELTLQALNGGGIAVADDPNHLAYLANLNFFWQVAEAHSVNLAVIGFYGTNDPEGHDQSRVASAELLYKWKPARLGEYESFLFGAQAMYAKHEFPTGPDTHLRTYPFGWDVWAQYQLSSRLYVGVRWDETDALADASIQRKQISPYFTWYTSEFFRARLTYEHTRSDLAVENGRNTFMLELVVVLGAHPPEPFWVNK
jgi:hypothetical protein